MTGAHLIDEGEKADLQALGAALVYKPLWSEDLSNLVRTLLDRLAWRSV